MADYDKIVAARRSQSSLGQIPIQSYELAVQVMRLRIERGLNQHRLAELAQVSKADICRIERGVTVSKETVDKVLVVLEASEV